MAEDFSFDDLRPLSWGDAFPWLAGAADVHADGWWHEAIDAADTVTRLERLSQVSELAMGRLTGWTIGELFPGLAPDIDLLQIRLPNRAINALVRRDCHQVGDLLNLTLDDVMSWRQVGIGTVDAILQSLAEVSMVLATPRVTAGDGTAAPERPRPSENARLPAWGTTALEDLSLIAKWYATVGLPGQALLGGPLPAGASAEVVKARQRLDGVTADQILSEEELEVDVAQQFDAAVKMLDRRAARILSARLFADDPVTLDQLGKELNVTRERVRQIESKARGVMLSFLAEESPLATVAEAARSLIGTIRPLAELLALMPALGKSVVSAGQPAWRVLDRLDDAYEIEDDWCVVPSMRAAESMTHALLQERADRYGVVRLDELELIETTQPDRGQEFTASWLSRCGYIVDGDFVLTHTQSVGDYGAAVLSVTGSPLTPAFQ